MVTNEQLANANNRKFPQQLKASAKVTIAASLLSILTLTVPGCSQADAFWFFHFKHSTKKAKEAPKKRELQATTVGLVPGNPPALYWQAKDKPKAVVLCLHELGLYKGVFDDLGHRLATDDIAVYAIDLRGFGGWKDEKKKKDAKMDLNKTLADVKGSCEAIRKLHPDVPVYILGEAMGGALALKAAVNFPELINGVISAAPGGQHFNSVNNYARVSTSILVGSKHAFGLGDDLLTVGTPKKELRTAFSNDEMVRMDVTSNEMMACQFFMYKTKAMAKNIKSLPVLVVHGEKDGESRLVGSKNVYDNLATKDKKFALLPDGDHYTFEDTKVSDKAFNTALTWLDEHIASSGKESTATVN
jgi:acylglycerol lipase